MATSKRSIGTERRSAGDAAARSGPRKGGGGRRERRTTQELIEDLEARIAELRSRVAARKAKQQRGKEPSKGPRFSPKWLASHREKLGVSAADYAALVGVSPLSVYNWEKGKTKPRTKQLEALAKVRTLKKREAWRKLEALEAEKP